MPIIQKDKRTYLEKKVGQAIHYVNAESILRFSNQLTPEEGRTIPMGSDINLLEVAQSVQKTLEKNRIMIRVYKSFNPWSKAKAYTAGEKININSRANHSVYSLIKTLVHETVHISDHDNINVSFGHGGNSNQGAKQNCAPQLLANMFVEYLVKEGLL